MVFLLHKPLLPPLSVQVLAFLVLCAIKPSMLHIKSTANLEDYLTHTLRQKILFNINESNPTAEHVHGNSDETKKMQAKVDRCLSSEHPAWQIWQLYSAGGPSGRGLPSDEALGERLGVDVGIDLQRRDIVGSSPATLVVQISSGKGEGDGGSGSTERCVQVPEFARATELARATSNVTVTHLSDDCTLSTVYTLCVFYGNAFHSRRELY